MVLRFLNGAARRETRKYMVSPQLKRGERIQGEYYMH